MTTDRWKEISSVLDKLLTLDEPGRVTYLEDHYGDDEVLMREVRNLLYSISKSDSENFLGNPEEKQRLLLKDDDGHFSDRPDASGNLKGQKVGVYELESVIGSGGMGNVYRARRTDGQFEQTVAVKFIHHHNLTDLKLSRFHQEQKILANLQHPNIGMLLDGGVTESGFPYLIMEYVDGIRIDEYCRKHKLDLSRRLGLFTDVLRAINYAHSNLVVHRDIKPGNILVTDDGHVKVLDFGIAKLISETPGEAGTQTLSGGRQFTPYYAAPEQILEKPTLLQTDIYALGMLMHTLLADRSPFDFRDKSFHEIERIIVEDVPPHMSELVRGAGDQEIRSTLGMSRYDAIRTLSGDLDAIADKAIRKEPEQRYDSVSGMLDDITRYRNDLPVLARQGSFTYRAGKFIRRNVQFVTAAALLFISISALVSYYTYQLDQERKLAENEAQKSQQIARFMVGIFESANSYSQDGENLGLDASIGSILDYSISKMDEELEDQPELNARLKTTLGKMYVRLGEFDRAEKLAQSALNALGTLDDDTREELAIAFYELSRVNQEQGNVELADSLIQKAIRIHERSDAGFINEQSLTTLSFYANMQWFNFGNFDVADSVHSKIAEIREEHFTDSIHNLAATYNDLAALNHSRGYFHEASENYGKAISIYREIYPDGHPATGVSMSNYSILLRENEALNEAWEYQYDALQIHLDKLGEETIDAGLAYSNLGEIAVMQGELHKADSLSSRGLNILTEIYGDVHPYIGRANIAKAKIRHLQGEVEQAEKLLLTTIEHYRQFFPSDHPRQSDPHFALGQLYLDDDRPEAAIPHLETAYYIRIDGFSEENWRTALVMNAYGEALHRTGAAEEADRMLRKSAAILEDLFGDDHPQTRRAYERMERLMVL